MTLLCDKPFVAVTLSTKDGTPFLFRSRQTPDAGVLYWLFDDIALGCFTCFVRMPELARYVDANGKPVFLNSLADDERVRHVWKELERWHCQCKEYEPVAVYDGLFDSHEYGRDASGKYFKHFAIVPDREVRELEEMWTFDYDLRRAMYRVCSSEAKRFVADMLPRLEELHATWRRMLDWMRRLGDECDDFELATPQKRLDVVRMARDLSEGDTMKLFTKVFNHLIDMPVDGAISRLKNWQRVHRKM